jgi:ATP-dependent 26S proteasome regulatory subunit
LTQIVGEPRKGDIIPLEDIDSAGINRSNIGTDGKKRGKSKKKGVTLSSLLNTIDSISRMNGVILIITSNNLESLDEALIRPGRIDRQVYMGPVSQEAIIGEDADSKKEVSDTEDELHSANGDEFDSAQGDSNS